MLHNINKSLRRPVTPRFKFLTRPNPDVDELARKDVVQLGKLETLILHFGLVEEIGEREEK